MTPKERAIKKLNEEFDNEYWGYVDRYEIDYHKFIKEEIVPHLSIKGIKLLTKKYKDWNEQGEEEIKLHGHYK